VAEGRCIAPPTEDVPTMLTQLFPAAEIAADHRRTLLADAEAHRLARLVSRRRRARGLRSRAVLRLRTFARRPVPRSRQVAACTAGIVK
jgi:hypothetical protein